MEAMGMNELATGKIGEIGEYGVTLQDNDILDAKAGVEIEGFKFGVYAGGSLKRLLMNGLRTIAAKTSNTWDDKLVDMLEEKLFPPAPVAPPAE